MSDRKSDKFYSTQEEHDIGELASQANNKDFSHNFGDGTDATPEENGEQGKEQISEAESMDADSGLDQSSVKTRNASSY